MEGLWHWFLVHRILEGSVENALVGISIKGPQGGVKLKITEVEAIHNSHSIWAQFG